MEFFSVMLRFILGCYCFFYIFWIVGVVSIWAWIPLRMLAQVVVHLGWLVQILAEMLAVLMLVSSDFHQSLQTNAGIVPQIRAQLLLWTSFLNHYLLTLLFSSAYLLILPILLHVLSLWWCCKINCIDWGCLRRGCWEYLDLRERESIRRLKKIT
jgi:hypothetical protein